MKIEKGSVKSLIASLCTCLMAGLIFFPLFDWIFDMFENKTFTYSIKEHVIIPLIMCSIIAVVCWIIERSKVKKEKK